MNRKRERDLRFQFICRAARVLSHPMWLVSCLLDCHSHNTLLIMTKKNGVCKTQILKHLVVMIGTNVYFALFCSCTSIKTNSENKGNVKNRSVITDTSSKTQVYTVSTYTTFIHSVVHRAPIKNSS